MEKVITFKNRRWIDITHPTKEVGEAMKRKYRFHDLDIEDCLSEAQRPKIDEYDNYLFIILHFPYYDKKTRHIASEQLSVFIGQNYLITMHSGKLEALDELFEKCQASQKYRKEHFGDSTGYLLYSVIDRLFSTTLGFSDRIQKSLKKIEDTIFESFKVKDQLMEIMVAKKNIIFLRKILLPQRTVIASIEHKHKSFLPENLEIYFDDVVDQIEKIWNILTTQKEVIESLEDTHESLLSHNINTTMKTLTVFSVIMLPLTFLTGLFGMNVRLPMEQATELDTHFWFILMMMTGVIVAMAAVFRWKNWL